MINNQSIYDLYQERIASALPEFMMRIKGIQFLELEID